MEMLEYKTESELKAIVNDCELDFDIRINAEKEILRWTMYRTSPQESSITPRDEWKREIKRRAKQTGLYIACEELNFFWSKGELDYFEFLWKQGVSIGEIAKDLERNYAEVALLVIDRGVVLQ
ncbi:hypothetical protein [Paenibacillus donghaensis]|uniref:hypothetical protein n=1 Tax=Paenibacillus donghaensis TaxID=414771 RepID=UPI001FE2CAAD|nr:hypothetical protein [Paenibacillus donghaensis]